LHKVETFPVGNGCKPPKLTPHIDNIQQALPRNIELDSRRSTLSRNGIRRGSVLIRRHRGADVKLLCNRTRRALLVRRRGQERIRGVHGGEETRDARAVGGIGRQTGLGDGDGAAGERSDEVGDSGEDVGALISRERFPDGSERVCQDGCDDGSAVGKVALGKVLVAKRCAAGGLNIWLT
jgi:hypothetical protein